MTQYKIYLKTKKGKRVEGFTIFRESVTRSEVIKYLKELRK